MKRLWIALTLATLQAPVAGQSGKDYQKIFAVEKRQLGIQGDNPYFPLTPGQQLSYRHGRDTEAVTVLPGTKLVDGVATRVVEDREWKNGQLVEVTLDYYAIDSATNDVYYMGEDVDVYRNDKVTGHEGSWLSGVNGAKFGLMMPGDPRPGRRFFQELAPGVGQDRAEILSVTERVTTPSGNFERCVHTVETSAIEKGLRDHKWYAPGVGPVKDGEMVLVKYGK